MPLLLFIIQHVPHCLKLPAIRPKPVYFLLRRHICQFIIPPGRLLQLSFQLFYTGCQRMAIPIQQTYLHMSRLICQFLDPRHKRFDLYLIMADLLLELQYLFFGILVILILQFPDIFGIGIQVRLLVFQFLELTVKFQLFLHIFRHFVFIALSQLLPFRFNQSVCLMKLIKLLLLCFDSLSMCHFKFFVRLLTLAFYIFLQFHFLP